MRRATRRGCRVSPLQLAISAALFGLKMGSALAEAASPATGGPPSALVDACNDKNIRSGTDRPADLAANASNGAVPALRMSALGCAKLQLPDATPQATPYSGPLVLKPATGILRTLPGSSIPVSSEPVPLLVALTLNLVSRGDVPLLFTPDGDYWLGAADAATLGLTVPVEAAREYRGEKYVSLRALGAKRFVFVERDLTLSLELPPAALARQFVDTGVQPSIRQLTGNNEFSSILNYQAAITGAQNSGTKPIAQLTTELATRWKGVLFRHSSAYFDGNTPLNYVRYETQAIYDETDKLRRWTFGDVISYSGAFGSTLPLGGISLAKFYGFDPRFIRFPLAGFSTFASTPSEVTVSYQGIPMLQRQVQPGPVDINNLYYYGGARALDVTIRDALGRVQTFNVPFYFTDEVLGKGIDEYSYQAGRVRSNPGGAFDHYGRTAALAFYRVGVTDFLTLGARGEASGSIANAGLLAAARSNVFGIVSANLSYGGNRDTGRYASASQAAYAYQAREAGFRISLSRSGDAYQLIANDNSTVNVVGNRIIRELRASASYSIADLGLFAVDWSRRRSVAGENITQRSLSFSKALGHGLVAFVNLNETTSSNTGIKGKREIFLNLNWNFGANYNAAATVRGSNTDGESYTTSFNKSSPNGPGVGYRIDTDSLRNGNTSGDRVRAFSQLNANLVQLRGDAAVERFGDSSATRTYAADVSGAVSLTGGRWSLSRPIIDSFAVVQLAEPIAGVKVYQNNQLAGTTDGAGKLLLPALNAFQDNQILLDHRDVPLDYNFGILAKSLYPPFRSGQYWQVDVFKAQTFGGTMRVRSDGQLRVVQPGTGTLIVNGEPTSFLIGNNGEFFLDRIAPGEYAGEIVIDSKTCRFKLAIPASKESYVKLGEIVVCE